MRLASPLFVGIALLSFIVAAPAAWAQAGQGTSPENASRVLAREIVARLHSERQIALVTPKLAPLFAIAVMDKVRTDPDAKSMFASYLAAPGGEAWVKAALAGAFTTAFTARIPDVLAVLSDRYASSLPLDDLQALLAFLRTPAGEHWAALNGSFQQAASDEGARVGAIAGADAVSAALKSLAGKETSK